MSQNELCKAVSGFRISDERNNELRVKSLFTWNIKFPLLKLKESTCSELFTLSFVRYAKFYLEINAFQVNDYVPDNLNHFEIFVGVCRKRSMCYDAYGENNALKVKLEARTSLKDDKIWTYLFYMMMDDTGGSVFHFNCDTIPDQFIINCEIDTNTPLSSNDMPAIPEGTFNLTKDLFDLLNSGKHSDIVLCVRGQDFKVHKSIIAARSTVFAAMFEHETLEKQQNRVVIEDIPKEIMPALLQYLYTGDVETLSPEKALDLFVTADKYSLTHLKHLCSYYVSKQLSPCTVLIVLATAHLHSDSMMKKSAFNFISQNIDFVLKNDNWLPFLKAYPELATELMLKCVEVTKITSTANSGNSNEQRESQTNDAATAAPRMYRRAMRKVNKTDK